MAANHYGPRCVRVVFFDYSPIVNLDKRVVITRLLLNISYPSAIVYLCVKFVLASLLSRTKKKETEKERVAIKRPYCHSAVPAEFHSLSFRMIN